MWRKHRFLSLEEQGGQDKIMAGRDFNVCYLGSTYVKLDFERSEELLIEFYENLLVNFRTTKPTVLRLIVDLSGAVVYNNEGRVLMRFQLSNIKDVIYCDNIQQYSKYFVLVGQEESDQNVKAHVLVCENKKKTKSLYQTFIDTFTMGVEIKRHEQASTIEPSTQVCAKVYAPSHELTICDKDTKTYSNSSKPFLVQEEQNHHKISRWNSPSVMSCLLDQGLESEMNTEAYLDNCFTELAQSRSNSCDA